MGKSNRCEIEGVWNLFPTPSLKLGSDWDYRLNPVPHYSYHKNVRSLFSDYNYTKSNRSSFVQKKKETFGLNCIQIGSLFKCLYSHINYIQHKSISKEKILRPFGLYNSSNGKEQPMWNRGSMEFIPYSLFEAR